MSTCAERLFPAPLPLNVTPKQWTQVQEGLEGGKEGEGPPLEIEIDGCVVDTLQGDQRRL